MDESNWASWMTGVSHIRDSQNFLKCNFGIKPYKCYIASNEGKFLIVFPVTQPVSGTLKPSVKNG